MTTVPFSLEEQLYDVLEGRLSSAVVGRGRVDMVRCLRQRQVGAVIPDYILIGSPEKQDEPNTEFNGLTTLESSIVATLLSGRPLRAKTIARRLYTRVGRITPNLAVLQRRGIVRQLATGTFALYRDAVPEALQVVAVEVKLNRWRDALAQAVSYLGFANQAYVAMPAAFIRKNKKLLEECATGRVGVLAVEPASVKIVSPAPALKPSRTPDWIWLISRAMKLGTTTNSTGPRLPGF